MSSSTERVCTHCGLPAPAGRAWENPEKNIIFCCDGCRTVYQIITTCNLDQYYEIKKQSESFAAGRPVSSARTRYEHLDDPAVRSRFACGESGRAMDFYMEGVHCVACLWLIERLGVFVPGVESVRMNLNTLVARVQIAEGGSFAAVAEGMERIGYRPHPLCEGRRADELSRREDRSDLLRIGVAGFCMMNIMILFISIYSGAEDSLLAFFRWLAGGLFCPVAFYSAFPFYRAAAAAVRARQMHIDIPVAGAIFLGSAASLFNLMRGSEHIYFDSLSAFVFLLLSARYLLKTIHQKTAQAGPGEFLIPKTALLLDEQTGAVSAVAVQKIKPGDLIRVPQGEIIAADGEVTAGEGYADFRMISGESEPVKLLPGSRVYAGTVNIASDLTVRVSAAGMQTRIERLLQSVSQLEKPKTVQTADAASRVYLGLIFLGATALGLVSRNLTWPESFDRALSLIIIACPCALALATPLAYRMAWQKCAAAGAVLKDASAIDRLVRAQSLFLDKTGTLTHGRFEVLEWERMDAGHDFFAEAYALEEKSNHPAALAVRQYALKHKADGFPLSMEAVREIPGQGVTGQWEGRILEIKGIEDSAEAATGTIRTTLGIFEDGRLRVKVRLGDRLRENSPEALKKLRRYFKKIYLITGDKMPPAMAVAKQLGISSENVFAAMTPEDKKEKLARSRDALMVGDGANDAAAMKAAAVAVAVQGSMEVSFQCADAYLVNPGIAGVATLSGLAHRTRMVVRAAVGASLVYNFTGIILALTGWANPLIAAVAMPLSSLTVLVIVYAGLRGGEK